jgi:hypothetical protein
MRKIVPVVNILLAITLCASIVMGFRYKFASKPKQAPQPNSQPKTQRMDLPVTAYKNEDARETLSRGREGELEIRRRLRYNNRYKIGSPEWNKMKIMNTSQSVCDLPLLGKNTGALPLAYTDLIVIGKVNSADAFLSADHTNIFSQFSISIERIIQGGKEPLPAAVVGQSITIERHGGAVVFSTGERVERGGCFNRMPAVGQTYIFFLKSQPQTSDFKINTAFEITGKGQVAALDGTNSLTNDSMPEFKKYDGQKIEDFTSQLEKLSQNEKGAAR